jgi:uncharacterized protein YjfI (DUF2170 family)
MERSLEVMKEVVFQFDGDLSAKVFGVEIDAQSIVEDYKWMINKIEQLEEFNGQLEHEKQLLYGRLNQIITLAEREIK